MQKVHACTGQTSQFDIAKHHELFGNRRPTWQTQRRATLTLVHHRTFGERGNFTVLSQRDAETFGIFHGPTHEQFVLYTVAVVSKDAHAGRRQLGHRSQRLALAAQGDASTRHHLDQPRPLALFTHEVDDGHAVLRRVCVGHRHEGCVATLGTCSAAGFDRLGFFFAGLAQVGMQVDKPWGHHTPRCVNRAATAQLLAHFDHHTALHSHVSDTLTARIHHSPTLQHDSLGAGHDATVARCAVDDSPASKSNNTAMRTATPLATC